MSPKCWAVLAILAAVPGLAQSPGDPGPSGGSKAAFAHQHAPMSFQRVRADGTVESGNWSGYAVTGSLFTSAKGSWTVPAVNCTTTPNASSAFWVGIDGYNSFTVEQTGTFSDCNGKRAFYSAWYEFYPKGSVLIPNFTVSPGNQMSAEVTYSGSVFTLSITNESTGASFSVSSKVRAAKRSSAEWIAEAPSVNGHALPLSDFGIADFGEDFTGVNGTNYAVDSSASGPISSFGTNVQEITMVNGKGADKAIPSSLSSDGTSFTVAWESQ